MRFFNIDCHISVIYDIQHIFGKMGHQVDDWCLSGHHKVIGKELADITLNDGSKLTGCMKVTDELCEKFYRTFKDRLDEYDGFIACYPASYARLYEQWNKPIIIVNCIRYEHPLTQDPVLWKEFDQFLARYHEQGKLYLIANNKGDQWYTNWHINIMPTWIPSLCGYTGSTYTGANSPNVIYQCRHMLQDLPMAIANARLRPVHPQQLKGVRNTGYTWSDLAACKAIVHIPYHNGSMTIFECYTAGIPMFFPSKRLCKVLFETGYMFDDLTFYHRLGLAEPKDDNNPNCLSSDAIFQHWMDTTDFYDADNMPHVIYFDSFYDLTVKLHTTDYAAVAKNMLEHGRKRQEIICDSWTKVLTKIGCDNAKTSMTKDGNDGNGVQK